MTDDIRRAGAKLVLVGSGTPAMARAFLEDHPIDAELFLDPSLEVYKRAGLKRGLTRTLDVRGAPKVIAALREGHMQGLTYGDNWQQGGTFIVWPGGAVGYSHVAEYAGDSVAIDDALAALRAGAPR